MTKIILVRHGQSENNLTNTYPINEEIPLTDKGKEQAKLLGLRLKSIKFDQIYCSPLLRAKQTLQEIIFFQTEFKDLKLFYDYKLRETERGIFNGKTGEEFKLVAQNNNLPLWKYRPTGGENYEDHFKRLNDFVNLNDLKLPNSENILIVAHDGTIRLLCSLFLNLNFNFFADCSLNSTAVCEIDLQKNKIILKSFNCCKHLFH